MKETLDEKRKRHMLKTIRLCNDLLLVTKDEALKKEVMEILEFLTSETRKVSS